MTLCSEFTSRFGREELDVDARADRGVFESTTTTELLDGSLFQTPNCRSTSALIRAPYAAVITNKLLFWNVR